MSHWCGRYAFRNRAMKTLPIVLFDLTTSPACGTMSAFVIIAAIHSCPHANYIWCLHSFRMQLNNTSFSHATCQEHLSLDLSLGIAYWCIRSFQRQLVDSASSWCFCHWYAAQKLHKSLQVFYLKPRMAISYSLLKLLIYWLLKRLYFMSVLQFNFTKSSCMKL